MTPEEQTRFWAKVNADGVCWEWTGYRTTKGYGRLRVNGRSRAVHQLVFEVLLDRVIPPDLVPDHLCRNRACVNPDHIELVTSRINTLRGYSPAANYVRSGACGRGHPLVERNLYIPPVGHRQCRECKNMAKRQWRARQKVAA